jgi:23S rRNA pseudouridine2605 synthase
MRLQKYLAQAGVASRRASEQIIRDGRVAVNGATVTEVATNVEPGIDNVTVDGRAVDIATERRTIILHKPRGYVCSASGAQGKSVLDLLDGVEERLFPVGRLDKDSEGLLLLTNDGELTNRLTHPRHQQSKRYEVTVSGTVSGAAIDRLNSRMVIDGYKIQPARVTVIETRRQSGKTILAFVLKEGRNRQIRKMCDAVELRVHRLVRTGIKDLTLSGLRPGQWRDLTREEEEQLSVDAEA